MRAARLSDLRAPRTARVPTHQQCAMQKQDSPYECGGLGAQVMVTTSNTTAHMAGALGVPTLLLLASVPDWRCAYRLTERF